MCFQGCKRAFLIRAYEARVTDYVGGEDSSETALGAFFRHVVRLLSDQADRIVLVSRSRSLMGRMTAVGHPRQGSTTSKFGHVRYAAESGSNFTVKWR